MTNQDDLEHYHCSLAKDYLDTVRGYAVKVSIIKDEIATMRATLELTGVQYSDAPSSGYANDGSIPKGVIRLQEMIAEYMDESIAYIEEQKRLHAILMSLPADEALLVKRHWIDGYDWQNIASETFQSVRSVMRTRKSALLDVYALMPCDFRDREHAL